MALRKQFSVTMENRAGVLARMCTALADHNVNILALMSVGQDGKSVVRMVVDKPSGAVKAMDAIGFQYSQADVLTATVTNRPGTLGKVAKALGEGGVNINYAYLGAEWGRAAAPAPGTVGVGRCEGPGAGEMIGPS